MRKEAREERMKGEEGKIDERKGERGGDGDIADRREKHKETRE